MKVAGIGRKNLSSSDYDGYPGEGLFARAVPQLAFRIAVGQTARDLWRAPRFGRLVPQAPQS